MVFLSFVVAVLALIIVSYFYRRYRQFEIFHQLGIPSADDERSFIFGNRDFILRPETEQQSLIKKYGKIFGVFVLGPTPAVVVADHTLLKEISIKYFDSFRDRPKLFFGGAIRSNLLALRGEDWRRVRLTLTPSFTTLKLKQMSPIMERAVDVMLQVLEERSGEEMEIQSVVQGLTLQVIGECVFALPTDSIRNQNDELLQQVRKLFASRGKSLFVMLTFLIPEVRCFTPLYNSLFQRAPAYIAAQWLLANIRKVIQARQTEYDDAKSQPRKQLDYLTLMLDACNNPHDTASPAAGGSATAAAEQHAENSDDAHQTSSIGVVDTATQRTAVRKYLTQDEMIGNAFVFLLAGYETTSTLLAHAAYCLATHPHVQERLYEEIIDAFSSDDDNANKKDLDYNRVAALSYLDSVINEVLRLYPPITQVARECTHECTLSNGVTIPEGMIVFFPLYHLMHDPESYEDPLQFRPERWSSDELQAAPIAPFAWVPFGMGPRNCIGMRFAQIESKLALLRLVRSFRLVPCARTDQPTLKLRTRMAFAYAENGVWIKVQKRK